jgi:hypothetical protein
MTDDQEKTKQEFIERFDKAKGRLPQSLPEIQKLIKTSNVVEVARKIIDLLHSIFQQFASDIQLKDLLAKAKALVANANLTFAKVISKDTFHAEIVHDATSSSEPPLPKVELGKAPSKEVRLRKVVLKKTPSKKKTRPPLKRKMKTSS